MPKIKYLKPPAKKYPEVSEDALIDLINRYQKAQKIKTYELAETLGIDPDSVSRKKTRGSAAFTLGELIKWCYALRIPPDAVAEALVRQMEGAKA